MFVPLGDVVNRWPFVLWNVGVLRKKVKKKYSTKSILGQVINPTVYAKYRSGSTDREMIRKD